MNRLCNVLCRISNMVKYIAAQPPNSATKNNTTSGTRLRLRFAQHLSLTVKRIAIAETAAR